MEDRFGELQALLHSKYAVLLLRTYEETLVEELLLRVCGNSTEAARFADSQWVVEVRRWSVTQGLERYTSDGWAPIDAKLRDPQAFLEYTLQKKSESALYIARDLHHYLGDPTISRLLRDISLEFPKTAPKSPNRRFLVMVSPSVAAIPSDLDKTVHLVDVGLPKRAELKGRLEALATRMAARNLPLKSLASHDQVEGVLRAGLGLTISEFDLALVKSMYTHGEIDPLEVSRQKREIIKKSGFLDDIPIDTTEQDIGGLSALKDWIRTRKKALSDRAAAYGLPSPKGILTLGPPGTGKSLVSKAIASIWGIPLLRLDMGRVFGGIVGESEANIRKVLNLAETIAPAVLWLDEVEKMVAGGSSSGMTDGGVTARVFGTLLSWLQERTAPVFVAMTANSIDALPPEFMRKGRIDEIFFVDLPDADTRTEIFRIHLRKIKQSVPDDDLRRAASVTEGFSGSEIEQVVISAAYAAFDDGERPLHYVDIVDAVKSTVPLSKTKAAEIGLLREWAATNARPAHLPKAEIPTDTFN